MSRWFLLLAIALTAPAQAQVFRDCPTCPEMMTIAKGAFDMGPAPGEEEREGIPASNRQGAQRTVTIGYSFAMGKYEVTRGEFAAFVAATGHESGISGWGCNTEGQLQDTPGRSWRSAGFEQTDRDPVMCVLARGAWRRRPAHRRLHATGAARRLVVHQPVVRPLGLPLRRFRRHSKPQRRLPGRPYELG
jgi:formylglycine-generating enzyme required for sulfatase activity